MILRGDNGVERKGQRGRKGWVGEKNLNMHVNPPPTCMESALLSTWGWVQCICSSSLRLLFLSLSLSFIPSPTVTPFSIPITLHPIWSTSQHQLIYRCAKMWYWLPFFLLLLPLLLLCVTCDVCVRAFFLYSFGCDVYIAEIGRPG